MGSGLINKLATDERLQAAFLLVALVIAVAVGLLTASLGWGGLAFMAQLLVLVQFRNRHQRSLGG